MAAQPFTRLKSLNTKECLWIYILKILSEHPTHAYAIRKEIEGRYGFRPGTMTAYKVLYLLHRQGLVKKSSTGRKKMYTITSEGKRELRKAVVFYNNLAGMLTR